MVASFCRNYSRFAGHQAYRAPKVLDAVWPGHTTLRQSGRSWAGGQPRWGGCGSSGRPWNWRCPRDHLSPLTDSVNHVGEHWGDLRRELSPEGGNHELPRRRGPHRFPARRGPGGRRSSGNRRRAGGVFPTWSCAMPQSGWGLDRLPPTTIAIEARPRPVRPSMARTREAGQAPTEPKDSLCDPSRKSARP